MSLAYAECPLDIRESLAAQYFVDAIKDEDTQHSTRMMDAKDLKSSLTYSMKNEAARTVSETSRQVRSMVAEDHMGGKRDDKFEFFFNRLKKLLNSSVAGKKNTPRRNLNVTCWKCNKKGHVQRECQANYFEPGKLIHGCLAGRRLPSLNKALKKDRESPHLTERRIYLRYLMFDVGGYRCKRHSFKNRLGTKIEGTAYLHGP
ncbi:hypothetical protein AVEN_36933-1 [Araneus ventricosus]|uniref:CCHC-type domain-containing protein n=1 Tax=Araneus ventricosus TaxID=182803 RepID=A0A4Y2G597_ARAVE|nr:hypothetical protein AVEN_36933-1 [Araneus ventricosus]